MRISSQGARQRARSYGTAERTTQDEPQGKRTSGRKLRRRKKKKKMEIGAQRETVLDTSLGQSVEAAYTSKFREVFDDLEDLVDTSDDEGLTESKDCSPIKAPQTFQALPEVSEPRVTASLPENQAPSLQKVPPTGPRSTYARIVQDGNGKDKRVDTADVPHRIAGPAPPQLRGFPNFPQSNPSRQNLQLGSGRLQNTNKLGNGATWGLAAVNGTPGLPGAQGRQANTSNASFAQTIGGSQPATPLDLSEFPSLSGNPQTQFQNPGQAVWGNSNQRIIQHTPVQRPQQQPPPHQSNTQQQHQQSSQSQEQPQQPRDDLYSGSQFAGGNDDYHRGGQGGIGQLGASAQPQPGSIEEFPPLGRNGTDENQHDRRGSLMQNAAFGGFSSSTAFSLPPNQNQSRQGLPNSQSSQPDSGRSSTLVDRITSPSSLSFASSSNRQGLSSAAEQDKNALPTPRANLQNNVNSVLSSFQNHAIGSSPNNAQPQPPPSRQQQGFQASGASQTAENTPLDQMAPIDRWGLAGLLATIRSDNPDVAGLAIGQDLTQLGLDLNSQEPLWPTWSGPFAEPNARPLQPDFHLPECYTVDNVHRLRDKIPSFSDETLFWIFYTQPRDLMQELAAAELTGRNWRYHKELMMWLTKDTTFGEPVPLGDGTERGSYIFFNQRTWQRARSEFVLSYESLAPHSGVGASNGGGGGGGGGMGLAMS
ncbi:MAG: hypothetical protein LQ338_008157 [Usnochroma carphineum]|nr:MAG: hypothetical protein LQ338_008157 [Usnochroma carphineum]